MTSQDKTRHNDTLKRQGQRQRQRQKTKTKDKNRDDESTSIHLIQDIKRPTHLKRREDKTKTRQPQDKPQDKQ